MEESIAKCGFNCGNCPSYKENLKTIEDRKRCSWVWEKCFQAFCKSRYESAMLSI
jgi:hypothetical protein